MTIAPSAKWRSVRNPRTRARIVTSLQGAGGPVGRHLDRHAHPPRLDHADRRGRRGGLGGRLLAARQGQQGEGRHGAPRDATGHTHGNKVEGSHHLESSRKSGRVPAPPRGLVRPGSKRRSRQRPPIPSPDRHDRDQAPGPGFRPGTPVPSIETMLVTIRSKSILPAGSVPKRVRTDPLFRRLSGRRRKPKWRRLVERNAFSVKAWGIRPLDSARGPVASRGHEEVTSRRARGVRPRGNLGD